MARGDLRLEDPCRIFGSVKYGGPTQPPGTFLPSDSTACRFIFILVNHKAFLSLMYYFPSGKISGRDHPDPAVSIRAKVAPVP